MGDDGIEARLEAIEHRHQAVPFVLRRRGVLGIFHGLAEIL
jgi:hypothetical protein